MRKLLLVLGASALLAANFACGEVFAVSIVDNAFQPATSDTGDQADAVQWTNNGDHAHTTTSDQGFWDSGELAPAGTYQRDFQQAGTFPYHCEIHPKMKGKVPVGVGIAYMTPLSKGDMVTIVWSNGPLPAGTNVDVQVLLPGADKYKTIIKDSTATSGDYQLPKNGTYKFRSRLQVTDNGDASGYSPPNKLKVPQS